MRPCCPFAMPILVIRWCGETGETKEDLCTEIVGIMERAGIHHRKNVNVRSKIQSNRRLQKGQGLAGQHRATHSRRRSGAEDPR
jgi:hypothetical protein